MGKCKDLSEFDKSQIVMVRRLAQSISKTAALGSHSRPNGPHINLANVLRRMPFLTQPSHFSGLGTGTASSGWG
ncbi:hypothetical protein QTP70_008712 [Hemibagrus guttatus]|uniref:Uncharacterized protein n=1 Tax=Hemibagrus guttatus TaxID=175788 RepID=A0AAE0R4H0_9TELE|nr:hypothetical protein QTP70_008712 [Hemibagrus guttatus]